MIDVLDETEAPELYGVDRPAWIPSGIVADWDTSPYAYQTEEELMSQGPLHDLLMTYIGQVMPIHLAKFDLMLWKDLFLLYRDKKKIKRRIGPDLILAPHDLELPQGSWDLDKLPVPEFLGEITSPESRSQDLNGKRDLYQSLGVNRYLVIDGYKKGRTISGNIKCRLWKNGQEQQPDVDGFLDLPDIHVKVKAVADSLIFFDRQTMESLPDMEALSGKNASLAKENAELAERIRELEEKLKNSKS